MNVIYLLRCFVVCIAILCCAFGQAHAKTGDEPASLQEEVAALQRAIERADFKTALKHYRYAYQQAISTNSRRELWELCAYECPYYMGQLGWLAGADPSEFKFLQELLDRIENHDEREQWRTRLGNFVFAHLGGSARPPERDGEALPLYLNFTGSNDLRTSTVVRVGAQRVPYWAIVDTGRAPVHFDSEQSKLEALQHRALRGFFSTEEWDGRRTAYSEVILDDFSLGHYSGPVFGRITSPDFPLYDLLILGTMPLLRHDAVCFDWEARILHLGQLGPCESQQRTSPYKAWLHSYALTPLVQVRMHDGSTATALVDTGANLNLCKRHVATTPLSFGEHETLTVNCSTDASPVTDKYTHDLVIGMDTLSKFAAFGWELNPFRLYFVPKSQTLSSGPITYLAKMLQTLKVSVEQGSFEKAFAAHRKAWRYALSSHSAQREFDELCAGVCPTIGQLGWLVDANPNDFGFLTDFVDVIKDNETQQVWREYVHTIAFGHLTRKERVPRSEAQRLFFSLARETSGHLRPWISMRIENSDQPHQALMDTGSSLVRLSEALQSRLLFSASTLTDYRVNRTWSGKERRTRWASLKEVTFGGQVESTVLARLVAQADRQSDELTFGTRPLLRHDAVCFDWKAQTLHLGELGPCEDSERVATYKSWLDSQSLVPVLEFHDSDGNAMTALISTGTKSNVCKSDLVGRKFTFGEHRLLTASCDSDAETVFDDYRYDMIIGMETLSEFSAWGWQLDPFRMYFVPPTGTRND